MKALKITFLFFGLLFYQLSFGQKNTEMIPSFTLTDVISNKNISLSDYNGSKAIVIIFTSNTCPYAKLYEDRIIALSNNYKAKGVNFLLINSNNSPLTDVDNIFRMKIKANAKRYAFPYLADKEQVVQNIFKAEKTPEAYVLAKKKGILRLLYNGAIDDNPQSVDLVKEKYIELAINNILDGKPSSIQYKRPVGCRIKTE